MNKLSPSAMAETKRKAEKGKNRISIICPKGLDFNLEGMEEELTCPICLELYADPLMLPCSHSVCKKCLVDIIDSKSHRRNPDNVLQCPSCRKSVETSKEKITDLPKNLALENIVIRYTEERSKSIRKSLSLESPVSDLLVSPITDPTELPEFPSSSQTNCELCESPPKAAAWYCVQCKVSYCHSCFGKYHPRRGSLARHKVRQPRDKGEEEKNVFCKDHGKECATMFCEKCTQLVCHLCVCEGDGEHVGHTVLAPETAHSKITDSVKSTQEKTDTLLATLTEHKGKVTTLKDEMLEFYQEACHRIEQQYQRTLSDITAALDLEKNRVLANMEAAKTKSIRSMENYSNENCRCSQRLTDLSQLCVNLSTESSVYGFLKRASEAGPLLVQYDKYHQETDSTTKKYELIVKDKTSHVELQSGVEQFRNSASRILNMLIAEDSDSYENIIPHIRSPTSPGKLDIHPRIQSKCLTTWGFTSTTFSADPLRNNCSWTVVIERNSGHWGSLSTGYLFGIGIASDTINVKDQVGLNTSSWGVICNGGHITFAHDNSSSDLMSVGSLPMSVMISVTQDNADYVVLSYKLSHTTEGTSLSGKKVIIDKGLRNCVLPVFTVSQRVKMLFPTCV